MYASEHAHVQAVMAEAALPGQPAASTAEEQAGGGEPGGGAEAGDGGRARTGAAAEDAGSGPVATRGPATRSARGRSRGGAVQDEELRVVEQMLSELHDFRSVDGVETSR